MRTFKMIFPVIFILFILAGCGSRRQEDGQQEGGTLVVANKSGDNIHLIDVDTEEILAELPSGPQPHEVAVSADQRYAIVSNYGTKENPGNSLSLYDISKGEFVKNISLGDHTFPHGLQWLPQTNRVLVTAEGSASLLVVDVAYGDVVQAFPFDLELGHMVVASPDMSKAFVSGLRSGDVSVIDLLSGQVIKKIYSGQGAEGIDASPDGKEVWVTNRAENTISIINIDSLEVIEKLPCEDFPIRGKFSPDGKMFLVSNARSGDIAVFDARQRSLITSVKLPAPEQQENNEDRYFSEFSETSVPIGIAVPGDGFAYIANTRSDVISVLDLEKLEISDHLPAGNEPDGIGFSSISPNAD